MKLDKIITRDESFADWYTSVIQAAALVDYASIKGMMIFQPKGWAIWQNIVHELDRRFATLGISNVQLPLFIRHSEFIKEKAHVAGFAPELFLVTKKGEQDLEEPYVIRPTSEIAFCNYFKQIIHSYNDLPIKYNQWCNVYRVEKTTRPFLRNSEFFWQELHTAHTSKAEAMEQTLKMIKVYKDFVNYFLCIPVLMGEKTEGERFAGANNTYTIEALMQDGQALQCGTSHYLGQNFSKTYEIQYQTKDNKFDFIHQTSAGISTRIVGAIIMSHADDKGLVLPVGVAPTQVAILPILADKHHEVNDVVQDIYKTLSRNFRVSIDDTDNSFGFKISNQEVNGTPISIIIGPKDVDAKTCMLIRRDNGEKQIVPLKEINKVVKTQMLTYQKAIYTRAQNRLNSSIVNVNNIDEFNDVIKSKKIAKAYWGGNVDDEQQLKERTGASPRCIVEEAKTRHVCFFTNKPAKYIVYFARAY